MRDMILELVKSNVDFNKLVAAIPHKRGETIYYGFIYDKYTFEDGTIVLNLWNHFI